MDVAVIERLLRRPESLEDTGLSIGFLSELALKWIYNSGELSAVQLSRQMCLPFAGIVQRVLQLLDREELVSIVGSQGFGEQGYRYNLSKAGIERVRQALDRNQYAGAAPVPLDSYNAMIRAQAMADVSIDEASVAAAFTGLLVPPEMQDKVGAALNSGRSVFLYGPPGNGKTTVALRMARLLARDPIRIPHAIAIDNEVIKVYDHFNHHRVGGEAGASFIPAEFDSVAGAGAIDERWVTIQRPAVVVGGELTLASLDLIYDPGAKYYEAPFQMKANGGMFLIDDFGRQQMDPQDLLNRWIVPLETRIDFLTLHSGKKIEVPFEQLVVFSTNLNPAELVDEAFLRRIRHKIRVGNPTAAEYNQIFRAVCRARGVEYDHAGFEHLVDAWYVACQRDYRCTHPRDIIDQLLDIARYKGLPRVAGPELLDRACGAYFSDL